jgi:hypothetical protein
VNTETNTVFSLEAMVIEIYKKICFTNTSKNRKKGNKNTRVKKINITPTAIPINQYHSQRHFKNNSPLISKVTNKSNRKNISGTNLLYKSVSQANVTAPTICNFIKHQRSSKKINE